MWGASRIYFLLNIGNNLLRFYACILRDPPTMNCYNLNTIPTSVRRPYLSVLNNGDIAVMHTYAVYRFGPLGFSFSTFFKTNPFVSTHLNCDAMNFDLEHAKITLKYKQMRFSQIFLFIIYLRQN